MLILKLKKFKVLKKQIKKKKKKGKFLASENKLNTEKNYLTENTRKALSKNKSHRVLPSNRSKAMSKFSIYKEDSDSGVSDINEEDFYDTQSEREFTRETENKGVTLPKIMGRAPNLPTSPNLTSDKKSIKTSRKSVLKSWVQSDAELSIVS